MIFDNKKIKENLIALCIKDNVKFLSIKHLERKQLYAKNQRTNKTATR